MRLICPWMTRKTGWQLWRAWFCTEGSGELCWHMWFCNMSRWYISCFYVQLNWTLTRRWLPSCFTIDTMSYLRRFKTGYMWGMLKANMMHSKMTMPWCIILSLSCSLTQTFIVMWNRERACRMIKLCLDNLKQFLGPDKCVREAIDQERKLQSLMMKANWRLAANVSHSKEQQTDMERHAHHG